MKLMESIKFLASLASEISSLGFGSRAVFIPPAVKVREELVVKCFSVIEFLSQFGRINLPNRSCPDLDVARFGTSGKARLFPTNSVVKGRMTAPRHVVDPRVSYEIVSRVNFVA